MLRKIASMLFQEEEIILEEDLKAKDKESHEIDIPEIKPISVVEKKEPEKLSPKVKEEASEKVEVITVSEKENVQEDKQEDKSHRSNRITADYQVKEKESFDLPKIEKRTPSYTKEDYKPQDIISPIFGGSQNENSPIAKEKKVKKSKTSTTVISPMYGLMEEETNDIFDEELLNYELKDMLSPNEEAEEVQVSLYDFLEELENEE